MSKYTLEGKNVIVTGGASFIGSHLVDALISKGVNEIIVIDNFSSGKIENLKEAMKSKRVKIVRKDLEWITMNEGLKIFNQVDIVFHLAAVHGGRGYIHTHPADILSNLVIDHKVFELSLMGNVEKIIYASSACVYPPKLQEEIGSKRLLKEKDSDPWKINDYLSADEEYGWGKLMGETQLIAFYKQYGLKGVPLRFVTVYGPRENETHAIIALIYKAFERMDPYVIWGTGEQERDFTYVDNVIQANELAATTTNPEAVNTVYNVAFGEATTVNYLIEILKNNLSRFDAKISKVDPIHGELRLGDILHSLASIDKAKTLLGYNPQFNIKDGLEEAIGWYWENLS